MALDNTFFLKCGLVPPSKMCLCSGCGEGWVEIPISDSCPAGTYTFIRGGGSVLASTGGFTAQQGVMSAPAESCSASFNFGLNYLSGYNVEGGLGPGFNYPQNAHLEEMPDGSVNLVTAGNTREKFAYVGGAQPYSSAANNTRAQLIRSGSGAADQFTLRASNGTRTVFFGFDPAPGIAHAPGKIKSVTDRYGNMMSFQWKLENSALLESVTNGYGRTTTFRYYGAEFSYQIAEIEDFMGRKTSFQYDTPAPGSFPGSFPGSTPGSGRLVAMVLPSITKGAEGLPENTFPGGTAYVYQYDTDNPRPQRQGDLIRVWHPNEVAPYLDADPNSPTFRKVDVAAVYASARPRVTVEYGQDPTDGNTWGKVVRETVGDPTPGSASGGGPMTYQYITDPEQLPESIFFDPLNPQDRDKIVARTVVTDPNGNVTIYDFNPAGMPIRVETLANRDKNSLQALSGGGGGYVTWTRYDEHNMEVLVIEPEGNTVEYEYDDGTVAGFTEPYARRIGLLLRQTRRPGNEYGIPSREGSDGQEELTTRYFYEPLYNQQCASIEARGNPVAMATGSSSSSGSLASSGGQGHIYFPPQNLGPTPSDEDRTRYATINYFDYQQNTLTTVTDDAELQEALDLTAEEIEALIAHVDSQMKEGGLPAGFQMGLGDINGDGRGDGAASDLPAATNQGSMVKIKHPSVRLVQ